MLYYTEWHSEPRLDGVRVWVAASGGQNTLPWLSRYKLHAV